MNDSCVIHNTPGNKRFKVIIFVLWPDRRGLNFAVRNESSPTNAALMGAAAAEGAPCAGAASTGSGPPDAAFMACVVPWGKVDAATRRAMEESAREFAEAQEEGAAAGEVDSARRFPGT